MGLFDSLRGHRTPPRPNLDALFRLPSAVLTLEVSLGMRATGVGSVAFRAPAGRAFAEVQGEIEALLRAPSLDGRPAPNVEVAHDDFGFTWVVVRHDAQDVPGLVTDLHTVNSTLQDSGFGSTLLCSLVALRSSEDRPVGLVYLFKQGTFYPFAPKPGSTTQRDSVTELQIRDLVTGELPVEPELGRWFAVWGAPGLAD